METNTNDTIIFTRPRRHAVILNSDIITLLNSYLRNSFSPINTTRNNNNSNNSNNLERTRTISPTSVLEIL